MLSVFFASIVLYVKAWLVNPATWVAAIGLAAKLPSVIEAIKTAKGANFWDKALEVAKIEAEKVAYMTLTDDEKRNRVVRAIFASFPKEAQQYSAIVEEIVEVAWKVYIKPNLKTNVPMNTIGDKSPICEVGGNCNQV